MKDVNVNHVYIFDVREFDDAQVLALFYRNLTPL